MPGQEKSAWHSAMRQNLQALKEWQKKRPDLFVKRVYDQTGLDI